MKRAPIAAVALLLVTACDPAAPNPEPPSPAPPSPVVPTSPAPTVAGYFSPPAPDPGPLWTRDGRPVGGREMQTIAGPDHCHWESATMLLLAWPPGSTAKQWTKMRQYVRDPEGVLDFRMKERFRTGVAMPPDAKDSGYRHGDLRLWLAASDPAGVYLKAGDDAERWPRADPVIGCY